MRGFAHLVGNGAAMVLLKVDGLFPAHPLETGSISSCPVSQVSTRLITFALNLITARLLTVDDYGVGFFRLSSPAIPLSVGFLPLHASSHA